MKLLTKAITNKLPKLYATDEVETLEKVAVCKFFNPCGAGTWYVVEGEERDGDFLMFGFVDLHDSEFGYISLNELANLRLPFGMKIERDIHFEPTKLKDIPEIQNKFA